MSERRTPEHEQLEAKEEVPTKQGKKIEDAAREVVKQWSTHRIWRNSADAYSWGEFCKAMDALWMSVKP